MSDDAWKGEIDGKIQALKSSMRSQLRDFNDEFNRIPGAPQTRWAGSSALKVHNEDEALEFIETIVDDAFAPWREIPNPETFEAKAGDVKSALSQFPSAPPSEDELSDAGDDVLDFGGEISELALQVKESIQGWRGELSNSFKKNYVRRFSHIIACQYSVGSILEQCMRAEAETWRTARTAVINLLEDAKVCFDELECDADGYKNVAFNIFAAAVGILSATQPAVNILVAYAVAAGAAGIAKDAISFEKEESKQETFDAGDYDQVWAQLVEVLKRHRKDVQKAQGQIQLTLGVVHSVLGGQVQVGTGTDDKVDAMDILRPPVPGYIEKVKVAMTTSTKSDDKELRENVTDHVDRPDDSYDPEPFDT